MTYLVPSSRPRPYLVPTRSNHLPRPSSHLVYRTRGTRRGGGEENNAVRDLVLVPTREGVA